MSVFNRLFNRKKPIQKIGESQEDSYTDNEEEDPEDEEGSEDIILSQPTSDIENQQEEKEYEIVEREILPAKIICPDCGGITLEGLEFCDKCGGELQ